MWRHESLYNEAKTENDKAAVLSLAIVNFQKLAS